MSSSGMLRHVAPVEIYVSEEPCTTIIRVTGISELGTLAVTISRSKQQRNIKSNILILYISSQRASAARYRYRCS
jgi:hypothetical protein